MPHPLRRESHVGDPQALWPAVKAMLHSVYDQPDAASVNAQYDRLLDYVHDKLPAVCDHLDQARADVLAFASLPHQIWSQSAQSADTDTVGIFLAIIRLVRAVLMNQRISATPRHHQIDSHHSPQRRTPHSNSAQLNPKGHNYRTDRVRG